MNIESLAVAMADAECNLEESSWAHLSDADKKHWRAAARVALTPPTLPAQLAEVDRLIGGLQSAIADWLGSPKRLKDAEPVNEARNALRNFIVPHLAAHPAAERPAQGEAVRWLYELATAVEPDGTYTGWRWYCTASKPCVSEGSVRNLRPLVYGDAAPRAPEGGRNDTEQA